LNPDEKETTRPAERSVIGLQPERGRPRLPQPGTAGGGEGRNVRGRLTVPGFGEKQPRVGLPVILKPNIGPG
jgi:hypothetical protein